MECHYCKSKDLKVAASNGGKVYSYYCEPCQKFNCQPQLENCQICGKEFEFRFDKGWKEHIICWPCEKEALRKYFADPDMQKAMRKYFADPDMQKAMKEEISKPSGLLTKDTWRGAYITVPLRWKK